MATSTCPSGHASADPEYCDVCGRAMDGPAPAAVPSGTGPSGTAAPPLPEPEDVPAPDTPCAACGAPLYGRFCEQCGHDSLAAPPPKPVSPPPVATPEPAWPTADTTPAPEPTPEPAVATAWTVTVAADRAYFDTVIGAEGPDAGGITFPPFCPERNFPLRGTQISIGRQSRRRGIDPDIDLTGPPEDPGVSHLHALLVAQDDGTWAVVDLDSSNGVSVNDEVAPLRPNTPRPLADGDRVYLGAWTRLTLRAT
ncbi:hypothetical protein BLA60_01090 [Actinophytocola xinjiangensis]|uniref:FHA domain-containing protein n=1 Tax=Actinophytocola xinjiangensis TaxID=485602 RepID=A0A7Z0WU25_9PSEU|nr:FHA domain-containing protein [Actinophytocola xinjiangensis]OLF13821.1 hypothetical protein BLA60_01090 [Actinophytocola xinjiangensis]